MSVYLERVKQIFKAVSLHSGALTATVAVLSFFVAYLQAIIFAHGQTDIANLVIQEVGIVPMWTGSLILIATAIIQTLFLVVILSARIIDIRTKTGLIVTSIIVVLMFKITPLVFILTVILAALAKKSFKNFEENKSKKELQESRIALIIATVIVYIMLGVSAFPGLPPRLITLSDGSRMTATKISTNDDHILIINDDTKKLQQIAKNQIVKEELCAGEQRWFNYTPYDLVAPDTRVLEACKET